MANRLPSPTGEIADVTIEKLDPAGDVVRSYSGRVLERHGERIVVEARYLGGDFAVPGDVVKRGDRFVETYYRDRWYNVFEVFGRTDGKRKGWYCNISKPAVIRGDSISWVDLALDVWISPDGNATVLDADEFADLHLDPATRQAALSAVAALQAAVGARPLDPGAPFP